MPVFKNESNGTWYVMARYVNWKGERKQKCKRGFSTKKEAQEWERMFQLQNSSDMDMSFEAFTELYIRDMKSRLKENTWLTKEHIIRTKILPYFGKLKISEISTKEVIAWQNEMLAYRDEKKKPYSQTYLKTLHNQLSAIRFSDGFWYKFTKKNVTKENAIMKITEVCGFSTDSIIAFGDDYADIGMLELCGTGVAMGNAIDEVKERADIVIGSNDEEGIADFIENEIL